MWKIKKKQELEQEEESEDSEEMFQEPETEEVEEPEAPKPVIQRRLVRREELKEIVLPELPQSPNRIVLGENDKKYKVITHNEALQEILEGVRELLKRTED